MKNVGVLVHSTQLSVGSLAPTLSSKKSTPVKRVACVYQGSIVPGQVAIFSNPPHRIIFAEVGDSDVYNLIEE